MAVILVVDDDPHVNDLVRDHLRSEGHVPVQALDGRTALRVLGQRHPDLVILDWLLPDLDGLALCRQVRRDHAVPIIMLTGRSEETDLLLGLEAGADDYVMKPFSVRELMARTRAALRRTELGRPGRPERDPGPDAPPAVAYGELAIEPAARTVTLGGGELRLTRKEFDVLLLLAANPGRVFSREFLIERVWNDEFEGFDRTVDTHIRQLRRKLGPLGVRIQTVWGIGYRMARL